MSATTTLGVEAIRAAVAAVVDPEMPAITIADLGVLRDVTVEGDAVEIVITPTYTACPAIDAIAADVRRAALDAGARTVTVRRVLSPPWTTECITPAGREALRGAGIAPPAPVGLRSLQLRVACPHCGAAETEETSRFGSTQCQALRRCTACGEPFGAVRPH